MSNGLNENMKMSNESCRSLFANFFRGAAAAAACADIVAVTRIMNESPSARQTNRLNYFIQSKVFETFITVSSVINSTRGVL